MSRSGGVAGKIHIGIRLLVLFVFVLSCQGLGTMVGATEREVRPANTGPVSGDDELACENISRQVVELIQGAAASVVQCAQSSDCVGISLQPRCWDSCFTRHLAGNAATHQQVDAQRERVAQLCEQFHQKACVLQASGCPGGLQGYRCEEGRCIAVFQ